MNGDAYTNPAARAVRWAGVLILSACCCTLIWQIWLCLNYPYPLDLVDGESLARTIKIARRENPFSLSDPYHNPPPFYPALTFVVLAALGGAEPSFLPGKLLNIFSLIAAATALAAIAGRIADRSRQAGFFAAVIFLGSSAIYQNAARYAPDLFGLALAVCGAALTAGRPRVLRAALGGVLCGLAIHAKQPYLVFGAASAAALIISRQRLPALCFLIGWLGVLAAGLVIGGPDYSWIVFESPIQVGRFTTSSESLIRHLGCYLAINGAILIAAALPAVMTARGESGKGGLILPYMLLAAGLVSLLSTANQGASTNYYLPAIAAAAPLAAAAVTSSTGGALISAILLFVYSVMQLGLPGLPDSSLTVAPPMGRAPSADDSEKMKRFIEAAAAAPDELLSSELSFTILAKGKLYPSIWALGSQPGLFHDAAKSGRIRSFAGCEPWLSAPGEYLDQLQEISGGAFKLRFAVDEIMGRKRCEVWSKDPS